MHLSVVKQASGGMYRGLCLSNMAAPAPCLRRQLDQVLLIILVAAVAQAGICDTPVFLDAFEPFALRLPLAYFRGGGGSSTSIGTLANVLTERAFFGFGAAGAEISMEKNISLWIDGHTWLGLRAAVPMRSRGLGLCPCLCTGWLIFLDKVCEVVLSLWGH